MTLLCPVCCSPLITAQHDDYYVCTDCGNEWEQPVRIKMAYIAHPFGGNPENVTDAGNIITRLLHKYPDTTYYSPLHATGFFYHELSYEDGMEHCYEALRRCDEIWFCPGWEASRGCNLEKAFAEKNNIPIKYLTKEEIYG